MTTTLTFAASVTDPAAIEHVFAAVAWVRGVRNVQPIAPDASDIVELRQMGTALVDPPYDPQTVAARIRSLPNVAYCEVAAERRLP